MGNRRNYGRETVRSLQGSVQVEHTLAKLGASKFRKLLEEEDFIRTFGAYNGQQAVQHVKAGLQAIYVSGWQVAAAANSSQQTYPDQSLYSVNSVPNVVQNINAAFTRQDQIQTLEGDEGTIDYFVPIIADAEAGFGGALNAYELTRNLIAEGAAAVHFEDQLAAEKKCGHLGGKVLVPTSQAIRNLTAARLASDIADTDTVIVARTDAEAARLLLNDVDEVDRKFMTGKRTPEGFYEISGGLEMGCERGQAFAEYADLVWCETSKPCLKEAKRFADAVRGAHPGQMLAYNCSPSFNWGAHLTSDAELAEFQEGLGKLGYKWLFITLAGFHTTNYAVFNFAEQYRETGMLAYSQLQEKEFAAQARGFTTVKHQREVGVSYFDAISQAVGAKSVAAVQGSTEEDQF
jgi:isocitrate lyase